MNVSVLLLLCFTAVAGMLTAIGMLVFSARFAREEVLARRIGLLKGRTGPAGRRSLRRRDTLSEIPALNSLLKRMSPARRLAGMCERAGTRRTAGQVILGAGLAGAAVLVVGLAMGLPGGPVMVGAALAVVGPLAAIDWMARRRRRAFIEQLPDVLGIIAASLLSGHGFSSALKTVAREMGEPAAGEFARVSGELGLGSTLPDALNGLSARIPVEDVRFFVAAVLLQVQVGGNLAELLRNLESTIRSRFRLMGELRAMTTQGRLSGWILGLLPIVVGLLFWLVNPEYLSVLISDPLGRKMVATGAGLQMVGFLVIKRMVSVEL